LLASLGPVETVGEFQVCKVGDLDVALLRRESKTGRGIADSTWWATCRCPSKMRRGVATSPSNAIS
jgi:hypothetical protein